MTPYDPELTAINKKVRAALILYAAMTEVFGPNPSDELLECDPAHETGIDEFISCTWLQELQTALHAELEKENSQDD